MLTSIEVRTPNGDELEFPLEDASEGYVVKAMDGLTPVKAEITSSSYATLDGEELQNAKQGKRNILMKLGLEPDYTEASVSDLRENLYTFFMPKKRVNMAFVFDDKAPRIISGVVESFDAPLFVKEPEAFLSLICVDPAFYATSATQVSLVSGSDENKVVYDGTVNTGIIFTVTIGALPVTGFTIYHRIPDGTVKTMVFEYALLAGDVITISTVPNAKSCTVTRAGVTTSILYAITPASEWLSLEPGDNFIKTVVDGDVLTYQIEYLSKYGGI